MMVTRTFLSRRADCTWQPSAEHKWPTLAPVPNVSVQESSARHNSLAHVTTNNTCVKKRWKVNIVMSQPFIRAREKVKVKDLRFSAGFLEASSQGKQIMRKQLHFKSLMFVLVLGLFFVFLCVCFPPAPRLDLNKQPNKQPTSQKNIPYFQLALA